jgi:hypothetical protein
MSSAPASATTPRLSSVVVDVEPAFADLIRH